MTTKPIGSSYRSIHIYTERATVTELLRAVFFKTDDNSTIRLEQTVQTVLVKFTANATRYTTGIRVIIRPNACIQ